MASRGSGPCDGIPPVPHGDATTPGILDHLFHTVINPFLAGRSGLINRWILLAAVLGLIRLSLLLVANKSVILKMLPFDNKAEFQVVLDMPEGTSLERTAQVIGEMDDYLSQVEEVTDYQSYVDTAAPINFNGLVRQYYLRERPHLGDIQVNLVDKHHRHRKSHDIARELRGPLQEIARKYDVNAKIVEIPPGPPILSPLVDEVYDMTDIAKRLEDDLGLPQWYVSPPENPYEYSIKWDSVSFGLNMISSLFFTSILFIERRFPSLTSAVHARIQPPWPNTSTRSMCLYF